MRMLARLLLCSSIALFSWNTALAKESAPVYVEASRLYSPDFLAPPPDAATTQRELVQMLELQRQRTPEQAARTRADSEQVVFRFADVLGTNFNAKNLPVANHFFKKLHQTLRGFSAQGKSQWARTRPPLLEPKLKPSTSYRSSGSYPSAHTAAGWLWGIVLAEMVPEKRAEIFRRAREYGDNRVLGGVHYPSDVETGRQLAVIVAVLAQESPQYRKDYAAARAEVRAALGLK